jgi:DNA-binding response OmpR family regulator
MKILMIEDERAFAEAVTAVLKKNNYSVDNAYDGEYGLDCAMTNLYDFIILDIMLPKINGLDLLKKLRSANIHTPVLMLTARGDTKDKILGLDVGADDYLPKPFHMDELLARLRALGRRRGELQINGKIRLGDMSFNPHSLTLEKNGIITNLTLKESGLLELLIAYGDTFVSKDIIIEKLWSFDADIYDAHVESQISLLRKKLIAANSEYIIKTSRGVGYRLQKDS